MRNCPSELGKIRRRNHSNQKTPCRPCPTKGLPAFPAKRRFHSDRLARTGPNKPIARASWPIVLLLLEGTPAGRGYPKNRSIRSLSPPPRSWHAAPIGCPPPTG